MTDVPATPKPAADLYALELWPDLRLVGRGQLKDVRRIAAQYAETMQPGQEVRIYPAWYEESAPLLTIRRPPGFAPREPDMSRTHVFTYNSDGVTPVEVHTRKLAPNLVWGLHWEVRTTNGTQRIPVTHHTTDEKQAHLNYLDAVVRWRSEPEQAYPELYKVWQQTDDAGVEGTHSICLDLPELGAGRPTRGKARLVR